MCLKAKRSLPHARIMRSGKREARIPTPSHPRPETEQKLYVLDLHGRNNQHCPTVLAGGIK